VEAASQEAVRDYAKAILNSGKDMLIMSVGALADHKFLDELIAIAQAKGAKIYLPSGAIAGLDGLKSAKEAGIEEVTLTTRKPPKSLVDAPYVKEKCIHLKNLKKEMLIYEGPAREAVKFFPANVNVAASLSLAGIGPEKTRVRIIADPKIDRNIHEIFVKGEFGELEVKTRNVPSPENPKTSYLAALSAIATLKKISNNIQVGT
jgi:aspartate dehydrogenase